MLIPTEAIATAPAISSAPYCHSAGNIFCTGNLFHAGKFFRAGRTSCAETPVSPWESPDPTSRTPESTHGSHCPHWPSPGYPRMDVHTSTQKGRVSPYSREVVIPPSDLPETSASPTRVSAAVTGMFHTLQSITMWPRQTLPGSVGLPPGLSYTQIGPFHQDPPLTRIGYSAPLLRIPGLYYFTVKLCTTTWQN